MSRFSRDNRLLLAIGLNEFLESARRLSTLVQQYVPGAQIEVLTCEDKTTYDYSTVSFPHEEVEEAMNNRKRYLLSEVSEDVWRRSYKLQLTIRSGTGDALMLCLSVDRHREPHRLMFYYQCIPDAVETDLKVFTRPSFMFSIGKGRFRRSKFNWDFGERISTSDA